MRYLSTRGGGPAVGFDEVLLRGLAPDGGLYAPEAWPEPSPDRFADAHRRPYADVAAAVIESFSDGALPSGATTAAAARLEAGFSHPAVAPLVELEPGLFLLELFHGPTAAFKDLAMQLVAPLCQTVTAQRGERLLLVTATSGDTGAAAVAAFAGAASIDLVVLHPEGRVSPVQRRQMTVPEADNVLNLAVRGDFDDCQGLVKRLLADEGLRRAGPVSSVNSINLGRLVGQAPYFLTTAAALAERGGARARFVVPTGNFGDAFSGWIARRVGGRVGRITAAVNDNDALARAVNEGRYVRRRAVATDSVSMDVQAPSNFERLVFEASGRDALATRKLFETFAREGSVDLRAEIAAAIRREVDAVSIDGATARAEMRRVRDEQGRVICPHTAVAVAAARGLDRRDGPVVALATAHPAKFPEAVLAALGVAPEPTPAMRALEGRPERLTRVDPEYADVLAAVRAHQALQAAP